jgi:hypothetical protein
MKSAIPRLKIKIKTYFVIWFCNLVLESHSQSAAPKLTLHSESCCENFRRKNSKKWLLIFSNSAFSGFLKRFCTHMMLYLSKYYRYLKNLSCYVLKGHEAKATYTVCKILCPVHYEKIQK